MLVIVGTAGGAIAWWNVGAGGARGEARLITATVRWIDGRISYPAADVYRPYEVARGEAQSREEVSMEALAELERRGDFHGVAAGLILRRGSMRAADLATAGTSAALAGERVVMATRAPGEAVRGGAARAASQLPRDLERVAAYLGRAPPGPDVESDRALLLAMAGQQAAALIALDAVLAGAPRHPQALWNRARVLAELGLPLSAAAGFAAVAALNEPGWSAEATERARVLRDGVSERKAAYQRLAFTDGPQLVAVPGGGTPEVARRFPGMARLVLYDAVRSAESPAAVRALRPLAATLDQAARLSSPADSRVRAATVGQTARPSGRADGADDGDVLARYVERVAGADFARRAPLARSYAALRAGQLDAAAVGRLLAALRTGRQPDILFGAILQAHPAGVPRGAIAELRGLADELRDPWFALLSDELAGKALAANEKYAAAEVALLPAATRCAMTGRDERSEPSGAVGGIDYRCASVALALGDSYLHTQRHAEARRVLAEGWLRAQRGGDWYLESKFLWVLTQLEESQDDVVGSTLPLVRAYTGELTLRDPEQCYLVAWSHDVRALLYVNRVDLAHAREELAQAAVARRTCRDSAPNILSLFAQAHVLRGPEASPDEVAALRAELAALRVPEAAPGMRALIDHTEGRLLIDRARAAGTALLERAIATARAAPEDGEARKAQAYAYAVLTLDAGRAGEWERVWQLLGEEAGTAAPARCALGVAVEDATSLAVVRDATGRSQGVFEPARRGPAIDAATLVPASLRAALRGCAEIEVIARPPVQGLPGLLPDEQAWSYRVGVGAAAPAADHPPRRRVVIADTEPPAALGMPALLPWQSTEVPDVALTGKAATPSRALAALQDASFVEIHSHGMVNAGASDASFLMLSPESDGQYALTAGAIRGQALRGRPVVVLAACHAAVTATYRHETWSLPAAFLTAGARAVIASTEVISDRDANAFFDELRARIERGTPPAVALHEVRSAWLAAHPGAGWVRALMVFQ